VTIEVVGFDYWRAQDRRRQRKRLGNARSVGAVRALLSGGISKEPPRGESVTAPLQN